MSLHAQARSITLKRSPLIAQARASASRYRTTRSARSYVRFWEQQLREQSARWLTLASAAFMTA
jgi:hypothetical protein